MKSAFDLKSARLEAFTLRLFTADLAAMTALLDEKAAQYAKFANMPFILDATRINRADELDFAALVAAFAARDMRVVALKHGKKDWSEAAKAAGLLWLDSGKKTHRQPEKDADALADAAANQVNKADDAAAEQSENETTDPRQPENNQQPENADHADQAEPIAEHSEHTTEPAAEPSEPPAAEASPRQPETIQTTRKTVVVTSPVRTGQQVYAEQADLVVLGMVSEGAEIIADGNIHVYAPMRGRALAGESGDTTARIFLQSMQAELVSIAGIYRVFEQDLPPSLHKKAVQIELQDDERLAILAINAN